MKCRYETVCFLALEPRKVGKKGSFLGGGTGKSATLEYELLRCLPHQPLLQTQFIFVHAVSLTNCMSHDLLCSRLSMPCSQLLIAVIIYVGLNYAVKNHKMAKFFFALTRRLHVFFFLFHSLSNDLVQSGN